MSEPLAICTDYWVPETREGAHPRTLRYHGQQPLAAVLDQIKLTLEALPCPGGGTALSIAEWLSARPEAPEHFPAGEAFAALLYGGSEGYLPTVLALDKAAGVAVPVITIKYLSDRDFAYQVVRALNEALREGQFTHQRPPEAQVAASTAPAGA